MLSEFSMVASDLAGNLEDHAASAQLDKVAPILEDLETIARELLRQVAGVPIAAQRHQPGTTTDPKGTGGWHA